MDKTMKITGKGKISVKPDRIRLNMTMEESYKEYEVTLNQSSDTTDYSLVIAPVVAELCTTSVALSAPPNSYQNNSQS